MTKRLLFALFLPIFALSLWACSPRTTPTEYIVTFVTNGGTSIPSVIGKEVVECPVPELEGYIFEGWYEDADGTSEQVTFPYFPEGEVTLYARYTNIATGSAEITYEYVSSGGYYIAKKYGGRSINVVVATDYAGKPVKGISSGFVADDDNIRRLYFGSHISEINEKFYNFSKFEGFFIVGDNNSFAAIDGVLYDKSISVLYCYPRAKALSDDGALSLPESVVKLCKDSLRNVDSLRTLRLGSNILCIEENFNNNQKLEKIEVDSPSFYSDDGVLYNEDKTILLRYPINHGKNYTLLAGTLSVVENAFARAKIDSLTLSDTLSEFGVQDETELKSIIVPDNNSRFCSVDGVLYDKNRTQIIKYPENKPDEFFYLSDVNTIGKNAFACCKNLKSLTVSSTVENIAQLAFFEAEIQEIIFDEGSMLASVDDTAFLSADDLRRVRLTSIVPPTFGADCDTVSFDIEVPAVSFDAYLSLWSDLYLKIVAY